MSESEFVTYFQGIAQSLIAIGDDPTVKLRRFARLEEVWDGVKAGIDAKTTMLMIVHNETGKMENVGGGNLLETHNCGFMLVKQCRAGNFAEYKQAYDDTLSACRKVVGKMVKDKADGISPIAGLSLESLTFQKIDPILDLFYGYEVRFSLQEKNSCDYKYTPSEWT